MSTGIYGILCLRTASIYIGKATNIESRLAHHRCVLNQGRHTNPKLQEDWQQHGATSFKFMTLQEGELEDLDKLEFKTLTKYRKLALQIYNKQTPRPKQ